MLNGILNAFRVKELRNKILLTVGILVLYRIGAYVPVPGIPFSGMLSAYQSSSSANSAIAVLNLFSGGALSRVSVFCLGIMPYITAQIIMQMLQAVVPSLGSLAREGESGQRKITQYTRYVTVGLALLNAVGYLFLFKSSSFGIDFSQAGMPEWLMNTVVVVSMLAGAILIMWMGEVITQRGVGNGMSLIIFANIISGLPTSIIQSLRTSENGALLTVLIVKVNTAGVIPIIFASAILYLPAQIAVFFPGVGWINTFANAVSSGWLNWILSVLLIVGFAYFYTSMVFNPDETADTLRKQGGFIPGVRPGSATAAYIKNVLNHLTLPGAIFVAVVAVVPSVVFTLTGNSLVQAFGGTSILIMVGVALDTISQIESQLKTTNYENLLIK